MRSVLALFRVTWLSATSYRVATIMSFVSLLASIVPVYFITKAIAPIAARSIALEGGDYFGFVVVGLAMSYILMAATAMVPSALAGSIGSGTFEALLLTRTSLPVLLAGLSAYPLAMSLLNAAVVVAGGLAFGVRLDATMLPAVLVIVALLVAAYAAVGLVAAALILVFRTHGPLLTAVIGGSNLLGGVFYSTSAIPGWLAGLSWCFPLTFALRATRRLLLAGASLADVAGDVARLAALTAGLLVVGAMCFGAAMKHARRTGTLTHF